MSDPLPRVAPTLGNAPISPKLSPVFGSPVLGSAVLGRPVGSSGVRWSVFLRHAKAASLLALLLITTGCPAPQTPFDKASDAVRELNMSARWGKMDVAQQRTASDTLETYQKHHELWHNKIRILDTELIDLKIVSPGHAEAEIEIEWTFEDDTTLRTTRLGQRWTGVTGRWLLEKEKRLSGSEGLFGEEVERKPKTPDAHFPVRVIR